MTSYILSQIINCHFPRDLHDYTLHVFRGSYICKFFFFVCSLISARNDKVFKFEHSPPLAMGKQGFFRVLNFGFFHCQKVNFQKFQAHFFKIVIESGNFDNTVLIEHIKTCFEFFQNLNFFKVNFRKF